MHPAVKRRREQRQQRAVELARHHDVAAPITVLSGATTERRVRSLPRTM